MGDSYSEPQHNTENYGSNRNNSRGGFRGGRGPGGRSTGGREGGGFRIRLSDNEMRAARSLQETFNLRSTVAVLGFAIRTLAQLLEEGKLEELVTQNQSQNPHGSHRKEENRQGSRKSRFDGEKQIDKGGSKPNPFARPEKPQPKSIEQENEKEESKIDQNSIEQSHVSTDISENDEIQTAKSTDRDASDAEEIKTSEI